MKYKKEVDQWWNRFNAAKGASQKAEAIRSVCRQNKGKDFYEELEIDEAIFDDVEPEFLKENNMPGYCAFLESLKDYFPDAFGSGASWHIRTLAYWHIFQSKPKKVKEDVEYLLNSPKDDADIIGDLLDILIANGFTEDAWKLLRSYYPFLKKSGKTIPWGIEELSKLSSFFLIHNHVNLKTGKYMLEPLKEELLRFDYKQEDKLLLQHLNIISSKDYCYRSWPLKDFKYTEDNLYILTYEFMRHLLDTKRADFVCAHLLQDCVLDYFLETEQRLDCPNKEIADEYLASWCGMLSLRQTKAFIILCGLILFYDFLHKRELISESTYSLAKDGLYDLRRMLSDAFKKGLWKYKFAEKLLEGINGEKGLCISHEG
ncbi:MAG: hypothetical protein ABIB71_02175 [Candidatus Woesearchaeota archaeon]